MSVRNSAKQRRINRPHVNLSPEQFHEFERCLKDPVYFLLTYASIQSQKGRIPFELYQYQEQTIREFLTHPYNIVLKSRQMGLSWLCAGFALWLANFYPEKNILMISIKEGTAKRLLEKCKYIYDSLPEWLQVPLVGDTTTILTFSHGSRIESVPTSEEAGRSEGVSLLLIDEAAFVRWIDNIWQAAEPTLSTGGMCILLSTANGVGNFFHKTWEDAKNGDNLFHPIYLPWHVNPVYGKGWHWKRVQRGAEMERVRTSPWYEKRLKALGARRLAQEVDCEFHRTGANYFDVKICNKRIEFLHKFCQYKSRWSGDLRIYAKPKPWARYVIGIDTASGHGLDYSCAVVREYSTREMVAAYRTQVPPSIFADYVYQLATMYNEAFVVGEENGVSIATLLFLRDHLDYPEDLLYHDVNMVDADGEETTKLGWTNSKKSRTILLRQYEEFVRLNIHLFHDQRLLAELLAFVIGTNGKAAAQEGYNDDLVFADMCCFLGIEKWAPISGLGFAVA